jgi:hypothetical protein
VKDEGRQRDLVWGRDRVREVSGLCWGNVC